MASHHHPLLILVTLSAIIILSTSTDVSIDCGSSNPYTDENSINWTGDDGYIQNGESIVVHSNSSQVPRVMTTSRVFTTRKKNCYSIAALKGEQVLVRASFYYGNYDKKSNPPVFDLQFDGNNWATVATSIDGYVYYEAIYVIKGDNISVCVAQTSPDMLPFISALEVRSLGSRMYGNVDSNFALFLIRRTAFGINDTVRYPDDTYDRIWVPAINTAGFTEATSDASLIVSTSDDNPPESVLQHAFVATNTTSIIVLGTHLPSTTEFPIYMNFYFSEISLLDSTDKRSFQLYMDDEPISSLKPMIPPYGSAAEINLSNFTASGNTTFNLVATSDSTLPPLINALEIFVISDPLTNGTHQDDVVGLEALRSEFEVLQQWTGDPCLPATYTWDWVNCSNDATPRVTALYLSSFDLSGSLPDFSTMEALETIDMHNNSLRGSIPDFLGNLPNLKQLNLANNKFSGKIPSSLSTNTKLKLDVTSNQDLCVSGKNCRATDTSTNSGDSSGNSGTKKKSNNLPIILGVAIPVFILLWAIVGVFVILQQRRKSAAVAISATGNNGGSTPLQMDKLSQTANSELNIHIEEQPTSENHNTDE